MLGAHAASSPRVTGDDAVLGLMVRVGRNPRVFANLVAAGFPEPQLLKAREHFARGAETPVEHHAARRMSQGYFDDEDLLSLFCRFYDCQDWRLESSSLFFARQEYERFFDALTTPIGFESRLLAEGGGQETWEGFFLRYPFDLAMEKAKTELWNGVFQQEHYWSKLTSYYDLRAQNLFEYLRRKIDVAHFSRDIFFFNWEREFRLRLNAVLRDFQETLERSVRRWQEARNKERNRPKFHYGSFRAPVPQPGITAREAMTHLGLDRESATLRDLRRNYRKMSKEAHPDQGGSDDSFRFLLACREIAEAWIRDRFGG